MTDSEFSQGRVGIRISEYGPNNDIGKYTSFTAYSLVQPSPTPTPPPSSSVFPPVPNLEGYYISNRSFIIQSNGGGCTDLQLNIAGAVVVNAQGSGGTLQNERDLCANDATSPTLTVTQRPDFFLNAPTILMQQTTFYQW